MKQKSVCRFVIGESRKVEKSNDINSGCFCKPEIKDMK